MVHNMTFSHKIDLFVVQAGGGVQIQFHLQSQGIVNLKFQQKERKMEYS